MLKYPCATCVVLIFAISGCAMLSQLETRRPVRDVLIYSRDHIDPVELRAAVGEEIRWHNLLPFPIHLGFLGVKPIKEVGCGKGFKTWFGQIEDIVTIRAGDYVSTCFNRAGTVQYNIWTDLEDPFHTMSPTAVIYLEEAA